MKFWGPSKDTGCLHLYQVRNGSNCLAHIHTNYVSKVCEWSGDQNVHLFSNITEFILAISHCIFSQAEGTDWERI